MSELFPILERYASECTSGTEYVYLATLVATSGSTYRRPGARTLFVGEGASSERIGLVSGGCIEADLALRCNRTGPRVTLHRYDLDADADELFGFGIGCKGTLEILLERCELRRRDHVLAELQGVYAGAKKPGYCMHSLEEASEFRRTFTQEPVLAAPHPSRAFAERLPNRTRIAIFGAAPDALPLLQMAGTLGWERTLVEHRSGLLARIPAMLVDRSQVSEAGVFGLQALAENAVLEFGVDAAIVMTHHLEADAHVLRGLARAQSKLQYVGLLGPASRRDELCGMLTTVELACLPLHGPAGLDLGGDGPESVALAIVAEIQAVVKGASAQPLRLGKGPIHDRAA
jgi:xanthine dehydrogenase accessory factor